MKQIIITLDTEMDADIHWKKKEPVGFSSILTGIPTIYRPLWDKHNICPIYFVSPEVVENDACCEILKYEIEKEKIKNLRDLIRQKLGYNPIWYRAARFGADEDTMKILDELGFKYDSSFTPGIDWSLKGGPDHSKSLIYPFKIKERDITEYPVTIAGKRFGVLGKVLPNHWLFYRWLRPTHMTLLEEKHLIDELSRKGVENLVLMFHSMEIMINKTPYVRNKWMQKYYLWRLDKTIGYAKKKGYVSY